ncbi:MAG: zinc-binding dehydrogenase [Candidatus Omnitrophota bacterium]|nr:zinc-binding dehydrogenase [Candidatus Omnitrophota bacterium]
MSRETKAAVLCELGKPLQLMSLTLPSLKPGQVLVEMAYSGVCHTQLLEARGRRGLDPHLPHTLGHEGAGTVCEIGPGVEKVKPGDRVVLTWIKGQGQDVPSTQYKSDMGRVNSGAISTFMRHTVTCENRLIPIPETMPLREAALLGCAVPTGSGIIHNAAQVNSGSTIAVFGIGGIGLSVILAAKATAPKMLIAVDVVDAKLRHATQLGATHEINAAKVEALAVLRELTGGRGVDYAIEAAGRRVTMETAFSSVREQGGLCVIAGNLPHGERISIDPFDLIKGKRVIGTWGGETSPDRDIPKYVERYLARELDLESLITHEYSLDQANQALDDLEEGKVGRGIIKF